MLYTPLFLQDNRGDTEVVPNFLALRHLKNQGKNLGVLHYFQRATLTQAEIPSDESTPYLEPTLPGFEQRKLLMAPQVDVELALSARL